jgi:hypothetical protein
MNAVGEKIYPTMLSFLTHDLSHTYIHTCIYFPLTFILLVPLINILNLLLSLQISVTSLDSLTVDCLASVSQNKFISSQSPEAGLKGFNTSALEVESGGS